MRFLKNKIARAEAFLTLQNQQSQQEADKQTVSSPRISPKRQAAIRSDQNISNLKRISTLEDGRATKNIAKNFGKAICTFAMSNVAEPYLFPLLQRENLSFDAFKKQMDLTKKNIDGLYSFRSALMIKRQDNSDVQASKRIFRLIGEIFIKYFSVNWIFHSKIFHRTAHLKYRYKILRRVQNPELFTYIRKVH